MSCSVLIAPDKFKGTLTATEAAQAIAAGWRKARPRDQITLLPISDGGDGFGPLMATASGGREISLTAMDAAHRAVEASIWITPDGTAIVESANLIGLAMLPDELQNPMRLDSAALGRVLQAEVLAGCRRFMIGVGGSATNDAGFGLARELGWRFLDETGREIESWPGLISLKNIVEPPADEKRPDNLVSTTVAVDVQNQLLGLEGCSQVFGPQKGLRGENIAEAEAALSKLAEIWRGHSGEDAASLPGAGAAGGLGFGLHSFAGAEIRPGFEMFAETTQLDSLLSGADLVLTGEGSMDRQTVMGKGVGELAKLAQTRQCNCIGLAGEVQDRPQLAGLFSTCKALADRTDADDAKKYARPRLEKLAHETALDYRN